MQVIRIFIVLSALFPRSVPQSNEINVGSRWQLFTDRWMIDKMDGVQLKLATPERKEIVLTTDKRWEGPASAYFTVLKDGPKYRMYYRGFCPADLSAKQVTCMAESVDGIHFTRPTLGLYEFDGSKENNIVYQGVEAHNLSPFHDSNPDCKPEERYKALGGVSSKLYGFVSPDGIHWRKVQPEPVMTDGAFDSLNLAFWDPQIKAYRCYNRYFANVGGGVRAIQHCTSTDFIHWTKMEPNQYTPGTPLEHFYTNATLPCPGAEHIYLSFPKRFVPERTKREGYKEPGVSDAVFLSSRDGRFWDREFLEAWVRPGPDPKNWTQRSNMPAWGILDTGNEFSMYISEHYEWPDHRIRRLSIRKNGFASIHADARGGEFVTKPFRLTGSKLLLNYSTSAAGIIQVEIQDLAGAVIADMQPLFGDELEAVAKWRTGSDLTGLSGKMIRLRIRLKDADLFALKFTR